MLPGIRCAEGVCWTAGTRPCNQLRALYAYTHVETRTPYEEKNVWTKKKYYTSHQQQQQQQHTPTAYREWIPQGVVRR